MIHPKKMRLYQEPNTRNPDQLTVGGNSWESGYVYGPFNYCHPRIPATYRHWTEFPVSDSPMTNKHGDLEMHSDENVYGWALNENDDIRLGQSLYKDLEIKDDQMTSIWKELLYDLVPLMECLQQLGISSFPIVTCLYLTTCTPGQLGKMWAFIQKVRQYLPEVQSLFQPPGLLEEFEKITL